MKRDKGINVLVVNQYALPKGSAGITRHADLGVELFSRGNRMTVIASRFNYLTQVSAPNGDYGAGAVEFRWVKTGTYVSNDRRRIRSMIAFMLRATVAGVGLRVRPDVVIGSSPQLLAGLSALVIARRWRVPFIFEVRDPWPSALVDLGALRRGSVSHRLLERVERLMYSEAARIITVMEHGGRRVAEVGGDAQKCVYIPNAAPLSDAVSEPPAELARHLLERSSAGQLNVIYAGAHGLSNGLHEVVEAMSRLRVLDRMSYNRLALTLVGDGVQKASLMRLAKRDGHENVYFHQAIAKPAMLGALQLCDFVLVHFAAAEFKRYGMSANKLFDAMAVGRPVLLASSLADTPVDGVGCGIRYEPGSPDRLASALLEALRVSPGQREAMGRRGRTEALTRYDVRVTAKQLETVLRDVVQEPS